jgi:hypothetical protein
MFEAALAEVTKEAVFQELAGKPGPIQGYVLAEAVAMWLKGHKSNNADAQAKVRKHLLELHITTVKELLDA